MIVILVYKLLIKRTLTSVIHTTNTTKNMEDTFILDIKPSSTETTPTPIIYKTRPVLTSVLTKQTYTYTFIKDKTNCDGYDKDTTYYPKKIEITITSRNIQQTEADKKFISEEIKFYMENRNLFNV